MSSASNNTSPEDGYSFNDLSTNIPDDGHRSPKSTDASVPDNSVPKPKRIACVICRKRKLKCDGSRPKCYTCERLGHACAYDEVRKKSGPKRGYVKALEERLKQVETLLKSQDPPSKENVASSAPPFVPSTSDMNVANPSVAIASDRDQDRWRVPGDSPQPVLDDVSFNTSMNMESMNINDSTFTWEMIGLGLDEPLPPQETIDELYVAADDTADGRHQIYFDKIHPSSPMIHKYRYLAAMNLAPNQRPPVALRYAMWTLAASVSEKYTNLQDHFYHRSRKYMEQDSLKGYGEHSISVAHAQTHVLLACYEFKMMYFPRAWMSTGAAVRLSQLMGLHRLDGVGLDVKQCLPPPRDWTEKEERRRTFWLAFCADRYASIGTGWPMVVDERDIMTNLPAPEEAFEMSKPETTQALASCLNPSGASKLSAFAGVVLMGCLFGRNLLHLHRPDTNDRDHDLNGEFWKRHRNMDNILLNISLSLPSHLKLPQGISNANIVFTNMNIHTSTICLHQAAIYKAEKNRLPASISAESKVRCITAANEIASIMRMISHLDLSAMNPFISFCLYVAARVYVQYLKSRPDDSQTSDSLRFLLTAMNALKRKNPLTESFLVQLDVDLETLSSEHSTFGATATIFDDKVGDCPENTNMKPTKKCVHILPPDDVSLDTNENVESQTSETIPSVGPLDWIQEDLRSRNPQATGAAMQGVLLGQGTGRSFESGRTYHGHFGGYGPSDNSSNSHGGQQSNRPTPNSTSPSETHASLQAGRSGSNKGSHSASPSSTAQESRLPQNFFSVDYSTNSSTGLTPGSNFAMTSPPDNRDFTQPAEWEGNNEGLTPMGLGVLSQLMGLAPMDIGWEGNA